VTDSIDERLYEHLRGCPHPNAHRRRVKEMKRRQQQKVKDEKKGEETTATMREVGADEAVFLKRKGKSEDEEPDEKETAIDAYFHREGIEAGIMEEEDEEEDELKYCWDCKVDVHVHSMHCQYCAKCVSHFDHHCIWFNTCIGSQNYQSFYRAVLSITIFTIVHFVTSILYTVLYFTNSWGVREQSSWLDGGFPSIVMGVNIGVAVVVLALGTIVIQLLKFHRMLRREKLTTHQYTVNMAKIERKTMTSRREFKKTRNQFEEEGRASGGSLTKRMCSRMSGMGCVCKPCGSVRKTEEKVDVEGRGLADIRDLDKESKESDDDATTSSDLYQGIVNVTTSLLSLFYEDETSDHKKGQGGRT